MCHFKQLEEYSTNSAARWGLTADAAVSPSSRAHHADGRDLAPCLSGLLASGAWNRALDELRSHLIPLAIRITSFRIRNQTSIRAVCKYKRYRKIVSRASVDVFLLDSVYPLLLGLCIIV